MHPRLSGLIASTNAHFTEDHHFTLEMLPPYGALLGDSGVTAAFVSGTTGEFTSLRLSERMALAQARV